MGIAYLTKASMLPFLVAFGFFGALGAVVKGRDFRERARGLGVVMIVVACFLATVSPYITTSKKLFGRYFYNVNTSLYMWAESWQDVNETMDGTGDREHWPDLPPDELPSPQRYFREHSAAEITARIAKGLWTSELRHLGRSFGYGKYLILYSAFFALMVIRHRDRFLELCIANRMWLRAGFAASIVFGYSLAYAFYSPIVAGPRLVLAIYLPTMFCYFWFVSRSGVRDAVVLELGPLELRPRHVHVTCLVLLVNDILIRMPTIIARDFAGS